MEKHKISIKDFGKDHWSTFAYIECCCVDYGGRVENIRMRSDGEKYPTRLFGHTENNPNIIQDHNDYDCAEDLETEGLIENLGTGIYPLYKMTDIGHEISKQLRTHKSNGGSFSNFIATK